MAAQLDTLICQGCGASLSYAPGLQALQCEYCDAVTQIAPAPAAAEAGQLIVPLSVEENALAYGVLRHLVSNDQVPDDMVERAVLSLTCFYLPCFAFHVSYTASWTASFGYQRTETYTDHVNRFIGGEKQRVAVTKNRSVIDWRPVNGQDAGSVAAIGYGGNGLAPAGLLLLERLQNLASARPFDPAYTSGMPTQPYALAQDKAYAMYTEPQVGKLVETNVKRHAQGDQQRDWHWNASTRWSASAVYIPVCHVAIAYGGKQYNAWVDGTNADNVATDPLPENKEKLAFSGRGMIAPLVAMLAVLFAGLASASFFDAMKAERLVAVGVIWVLCLWREGRRARRAQQTRLTALAKRAQRYAQPVAAPVPAAPQGGTDLGSLAMSLLSTAILCVLLYKLVNDPAPDAAAPVAAPAAATVAAAGVPATPAVKPVRALSPIMAAANAQDWATVESLAAQTRPQVPPSASARADSVAAVAHGNKALLKKDYEAAITAFHVALEADSANTDARNKLGAALMRAGDHERARNVLVQLVGIAPGHVEGWRNLAEAAALSGQPDQADASLRMLLHLSKDRKRTAAALKKRAATGKPDKFSEAIARIVKPGATKARS